MRVIAVLMMGALLAACGADGEPIQPTANTNVNITSRGVSVGTNVQLGTGPFALNIGLGL